MWYHSSPVVKAVCTSCVLWLLHSPVSEQPMWIAHILQKMGDLAVNQLGHLNEWRSKNYNPGLQQVARKKNARASWFPSGVLLSLRTGPRSKRKLLWRIQVTSQHSLSNMAVSKARSQGWKKTTTSHFHLDCFSVICV